MAPCSDTTCSAAWACAAIDLNHDGLVQFSEFSKWYVHSEQLVRTVVNQTIDEVTEQKKAQTKLSHFNATKLPKVAARRAFAFVPSVHGTPLYPQRTPPTRASR